MNNQNKILIFSSISLIMGLALFVYFSDESPKNFAKYMQTSHKAKNKGRDISSVKNSNRQLAKLKGVKEKDLATKKPRYDKNAKRVFKLRRLAGIGNASTMKNNIKNKLKAQKSKYINIGDLQISLLDDTFAVKISDIDEKQYKIIEERKGYYLVEAKDGVSVHSLPVVAVEGSSTLGIFTGVLKLKFNNYSKLETVLDGKNFDYIITQKYPGIDRAFFQFDNYSDTMSAFEELKKSQDIDTVEIEILQYQRSAR